MPKSIYRVRTVRHPAAPEGQYYEVYNQRTGKAAGAYASFLEASDEVLLRNRLQRRPLQTTAFA
ncbi:hypothetical protein MHM84_08980 [Halomonas sp. McH1-25]|uniref:hypothetical protein n=1 Tax=unclassified Halomonas TaxID=2609666 RepID=UPI001EF5368C|nr:MULTISPECIES: hypothetical protein [unclassified Halomonas]MCG7599920.1 hypothetical protein [Halomonas sp. McH1-25]MCP1342611.1 hypothetical protein [Halomonas sp. FL8]MCP1361326.1 hypothetical protein [Halomonas sp. BBD45]MCP1364917.1 hypothetical protein [Halomonas sp. BBD48]